MNSHGGENVTMEKFWAWYKVDGVDSDGDPVTGAERWCEFKKYLWFDLGKSIWKGNCCIFQDNVKYVHNYIVKLFTSGIIQKAIYGLNQNTSGL